MWLMSQWQIIFSISQFVGVTDVILTDNFQYQSEFVDVTDVSDR